MMTNIQRTTRRAQATAHLAAIRVELARHPAVKAALALFPPALRKEVNIHVSDYSDNVNLSLSIRNLDSFKDKSLAKLLAKFSDDTWAAHSNDYTHSDTPNRDFSFARKVAWTPKPSKHTRWLETTKDEYGYQEFYAPTTFDLRVTLYTYVKSDSPMCRVEITGVVEKVVREEVRQIVCA